jgi:NADH-quinone oxidoreductase subunit H
MKFAAFFMAEYANMITVASMTTILFLGGWQPPFPVSLGSNYVATAIFALAGAICLYHGIHPARRLDRYTLPAFAVVFFALAIGFLIPGVVAMLMPVFWFVAKTSLLLFVFIWIRGTLPRFRYDQLMSFAWKFLFPVAVLNLLVTGLLVALFT